MVIAPHIAIHLVAAGLDFCATVAMQVDVLRNGYIQRCCAYRAANNFRFAATQLHAAAANTTTAAGG